jgi:hypothetical protein
VELSLLFNLSKFCCFCAFTQVPLILPSMAPHDFYMLAERRAVTHTDVGHAARELPSPYLKEFLRVNGAKLESFTGKTNRTDNLKYDAANFDFFTDNGRRVEASMLVRMRRPQGVLSMDNEMVAAADMRAAAARAGALVAGPALPQSAFAIPTAPRRGPPMQRRGGAHSLVHRPWVRCFRCRVLEATYHFGLCGHTCCCGPCLRHLLGNDGSTTCLDCGQLTADEWIFEV